jgi:hypothetical protein
MLTGDIMTHVTASKHLTAEAAKAMRRAVYQDSTIDPAELETLFVLDEAAERRDPEWSTFFVEAVTDFIVNQEEPRGYVSEANGRWLIDRIAKDGVVTTASELELLVTVLEKATSSPDQLSAFALDQVKHAVVQGDGPLAKGVLEPGRVGADEADLIRRVLYAFGGDRNIAVTRAEAEVLFDINDATAEADNDPAWADLFVKALANTLMAASGYQAPSREVALRREEWLSSETGGVGDFFSKMVSGGLKGVFDAYRQPDMEERWAERNQRFAEASATAEAVSEAEAAWLAERIGRNGALHENEKAVLRFIAEQSPDIHPSLKPLIDKAA